jgi:hypothetical protein
MSVKSRSCLATSLVSHPSKRAQRSACGRRCRARQWGCALPAACHQPPTGRNTHATPMHPRRQAGWRRLVRRRACCACRSDASRPQRRRYAARIQRTARLQAPRRLPPGRALVTSALSPPVVTDHRPGKGDVACWRPLPGLGGPWTLLRARPGLGGGGAPRWGGLFPACDGGPEAGPRTGEQVWEAPHPGEAAREPQALDALPTVPNRARRGRCPSARVCWARTRPMARGERWPRTTAAAGAEVQKWGGPAWAWRRQPASCWAASTGPW